MNSPSLPPLRREGTPQPSRPDTSEEGDPCLLCGEPVEHPDCIICLACCEAELQSQAGGVIP